MTGLDRLRLAIFCWLVVALPISNAMAETGAVLSIVFWMIHLLRDPRSARPLPAWPFLVAFLAIALASLTWSTHPELTWRAWSRKWLEYGLLSLAVADGVQRRWPMRPLAMAVAASVGVLCLDALAQWFFHDDLLRHKPMYAHTITGPFPNPNGLAGYLGVCLPLLVALTRPALVRTPQWRRFNLALMACTVFVIAWTTSIGTWVAILAALPIGWAFLPPLRDRSTLKIGAGAALLSIPLVLWLVPSFLDGQPGVTERLQIWATAMRMIQEAPFLGLGLGTFMANYERFRVAGDVIAYAHNCYLQITAELGLVGLASFLVWIGMVLWYAIRPLRHAPERPSVVMLAGLVGGILVALFHACVDVNFFSLRLAIQFWLWAGWAMGLTRVVERAGEEEPVGEAPSPSRPVRVLRVVTRLNIGGPAQHAIWLNAKLNRLGYETLLASGPTDPTEGDRADLAKRAGLRHEIIPELGREVSLWHDVVALVKLIRLMRRFRPHVVHTHMAKAGALGRLAAALLRVPLIVHTFHGHTFAGYFPRWQNSIFLVIERIAARWTQVIIAISHAQAEELVTRYRVVPRHKVRMIPLGLPLEQITQPVPRGQFRRACAIPDNRFLIGCVGRLVPIKNIQMFLEVAARLKAQDGARPLHWAIVGDGPERAALERYAVQLGLRDRVTFCGWCDDLASLYADLDLLTLTSQNEGTPIALIEAMAAGKPVVATAVGGVVDLIQDLVTGLLVPPGRADAFAEAVGRLVDDPDARHRLGEAAQRFVTARYRLERLVRDIDQLYQEGNLQKR